ncbi:cation/H(+) antiporter [Pseudoxanthomonas broegbernensis]|uniref:Cation/H(+) antiporter n=1 Tax=Pseudoxanthomonas broegbernensis TaxID=83619 RepID=A0A7V8GLS8_9GAMM|nr:cation:proton antiporter [Pseudoxanthomonas broegbernensis]KAF1686057.1 cation/H(+) antiporter [Pseudoxanthomonas broegbernensis]MBB6063685.1 Kef-type K+ transport system membrane component KefB [Pseudoxanthomonas broegbernensis]
MNTTLLLLMQLVVILALARLCGAVLARVGQPPVIGEMAAGLLLGPIVFGAWMPELHAALFSPASLPALSGLGTMGVALFMFIVGVELRAPEGSRAQLRAAFSIGMLGIALPLALGLAISPVLYDRFAPAGVGYWPFAMFIAAAMSVTAFPVLARILKDRRLTHTTPGRLALSAAVIDDGCVWIFLAVVLALAGGGSPAGVVLAIGGGLGLVAAVFLVLKPLYAWLLRPAGVEGDPAASGLVWILVGMLGCAAVAEWIGLHAVFGAFLFGVCLPREDRLLACLARRIEPVAILLLMPVVFALAGQNTTPEAFAGAGIGMFGLILLAAVAGKVIGCSAGARLNGYGWRDSLAVGSLMNARGLMELIVIKIGFDAGLIGPALFTLLFAMTLATTLIASPLLSLFYRHGSGRLAGHVAGAVPPPR